MAAMHSQYTFNPTRVASTFSQRTRRARALPVVRVVSASATKVATSVWHCPPPDEERTATQAASTLSKLPPHTLGDGGLDPSTQSPQNQQAYLGSLAERFLPVDLSYRGVRVLNVDPPIFAVPDFIPSAECDALATLAVDEGAKGDVKNVKSVSLGAKLPAPLADGMPALAQRLGELVEDARGFVRCDGAWLEGAMMNAWGMTGGFSKTPPPGAFAFEMPTLNVVAGGKVSDTLLDAFDRVDANENQYQRRALVRVFLTDPPPEPAEQAEDESPPEIDRDAYTAKFVICDIGVAPAKGTAIITFPSFADGMSDERTNTVVKGATAKAPTAWIDFPISVGLEEGGIAAPVTMDQMGVVEKVGEEANVGTAARDKNRQEWRANISGGDGDGDGDGGEDAAATEEAKKKLEELEALEKDAGK